MMQLGEGERIKERVSLSTCNSNYYMDQYTETLLCQIWNNAFKCSNFLELILETFTTCSNNRLLRLSKPNFIND